MDQKKLVALLLVIFLYTMVFWSDIFGEKKTENTKKTDINVYENSDENQVKFLTEKPKKFLVKENGKEKAKEKVKYKYLKKKTEDKTPLKTTSEEISGNSKETSKMVEESPQLEDTSKIEKIIEKKIKVHKVLYKETLASIARHYYGCKTYKETKEKIELILKANTQIKNENSIKIGQEIRIPDIYTFPSTNVVTVKDKENKKQYCIIHKVKIGDTLQKIYCYYHKTVIGWTNLFKFNPDIKNPDKLKIGDTVLVPASNNLIAKMFETSY